MFKWLFKKKGCAKHMNNKLEVIGIDHGWSMMKTISQVFVTGVKEITTTPALFGDVLEYEGKFYKVGTVRQEVKDTKVEDDSFYLLTLAAVAKELKRRGLAEAKVFLAVGLPLTRFGAEKNDFIKYLTKNKRVDFKYENESYHIEIDDVAVFPQCYAAVVDKIPAMAKKTLIVDIGSWTIDIMPVINKSPDESKCVTIPKGLITCMRSINEQCVRQLNGEVDESEIQNIMRYGRSDIDDEYFAIIKAEIEDFVDKVYNSIREFGYNLKTTPIVFVGGGAVVMKNFGSHDAKNISYNLDVKANARGYEQLAVMGLKECQEAGIGGGEMAKLSDYEVKTTIRMNMNNPDHVLVNNVIQNLDPSIFKSKNQFILEACKFYIDNYGKDTFIAKKKEKERAEFIRSEDIEEIKTEMIEAAISEARKEVIKLLGGVISGMNVPQSTVRAVAEVPEEELSDDVMDDADVAGLAMGWMSKGD